MNFGFENEIEGDPGQTNRQCFVWGQIVTEHRSGIYRRVILKTKMKGFISKTETKSIFISLYDPIITSAYLFNATIGDNFVL